MTSKPSREEAVDLAIAVLKELHNIADILGEIIHDLNEQAQKKGRGLTRPFLLLLVVIPAIQQEDVSP